MKLYNSYTLQVEQFKPIKENEVSMYVCGPTVYNHAHIGNARPIVVFDTLRRTFEALGYKVKMVSNFTDVDDKIINKAIYYRFLKGCSKVGNIYLLALLLCIVNNIDNSSF